jgi:hypothetical protein
LRPNEPAFGSLSGLGDVALRPRTFDDTIGRHALNAFARARLKNSDYVSASEDHALGIVPGALLAQERQFQINTDRWDR